MSGVGVTAAFRYVRSIFVVKEEVPVEISFIELDDVAAVRGGVFVRKEVNWHPSTVSDRGKIGP